MRVAIRVDASRHLGLGHLKRCLALAVSLKEAGADVLFLWGRHDLDVAAYVRCAGFPCKELGPPEASNKIALKQEGTVLVDAQRSIEALSAWRPSWVVVDHYDLNADWHEKVSATLGARIAVIDDLANRPLAADVVVDPNFSNDHRRKFGSLVDGDTELFAGPRFSLLGECYANARRYVFREDVHSIGIFMGGTDPANVSPVALSACRDFAGFAGPIEIVTTSANPHYDELQKACARSPRTSLLADLDDLSEFFARHDLQIGAGGGATWERCCIGAPTLALVCADNQKVVIPALHELGVVATSDTLSPESLGDVVSRLLRDPEERMQLSDRARGMVDGIGARRVALVLARSLLRVRPAEGHDAGIMFEWRNDAATRRTARNNALIPWDDHEAWLGRSLKMEDRLLLIAEIGRIPVGVVRFDRQSDEAEVSLYLDPHLHGLGLGRLALLHGEAAASIHWPSLEGFTAETLEHNLGSQRLFVGAGYSGTYSRFYKTKSNGIQH